MRYKGASPIAKEEITGFKPGEVEKALLCLAL